MKYGYIRGYLWRKSSNTRDDAVSDEFSAEVDQHDKASSEKTSAPL